MKRSIMLKLVVDSVRQTRKLLGLWEIPFKAVPAEEQ
jgi:hypothetical protein